MEPTHDCANRFAHDNRTWAELPRRQRRFYLWLVLTFVLVDPLARIIFELLGLSESLASVLGVVLSVVIVSPFAWAAWREAKQRKMAGLTPPLSPVTRRTLTGWIGTAILLWVLYAILVASQGFVLPVLPIAVSFLAARRWIQRRSQKR